MEFDIVAAFLFDNRSVSVFLLRFTGSSRVRAQNPFANNELPGLIRTMSQPVYR
jgi:hypothetical protein